MAEADVFLPCNMDHISDQATFQRYESSVASALKANTPWQMVWYHSPVWMKQLETNYSRLRYHFGECLLADPTSMSGIVA